MKTNQTEKPLIRTDAAEIADIAAISIAIERYIAQLVGFARSYQLITWEMEIIITRMIGTKNIPRITPSLFDLIHAIIISLIFEALYQSQIVD